MSTREAGRLALSACVGAAISATCLISWPITGKISNAATGTCDCSCGADADLQPGVLESRSVLTTSLEASPRGASLLQSAATYVENDALVPMEGLDMAFGTVVHKESAWLSDEGNSTQIKPTEVDPSEREWLDWLRKQIDEDQPDFNATDDEPYFNHKALTEEVKEHDVDFMGASVWLILMTSIPIGFAAMHGRETTWTHVWQCLALLVWLIWGLFMFCYVIKFESSHWKDQRTLNLVESCYLIAQIITTVGYGDITPAYRRGQVVIGLFVLFGLIMVANVASQMGSLFLKSMDDLTARLRTQTLTDTLERATISMSLTAAPSLASAEWKEWLRKKVAMTHMESNLGKAVLVYLLLCVIGIFVFHYSEEKSWLEAVYMTIITSASLGFGACTPVTRHGMAFSAFWMLCSCAALGMVIGNFSHLMLLMEREEQINFPKRRKEFKRYCESVRKVDDKMNRYEFTRLMLLYSGMVHRSDLICLENIFNELNPVNNLVSIDAIERACFEDQGAKDDQQPIDKTSIEDIPQ
mmetsp:Transcript_48770/g.91319  ORF Transcript_48770/g.91319 Transcript_48770/m.91319 type:complete len:526 (+) Transcript_48770:56-1633(+)